jgi:hypothetical protein
MFNRGTFIIRTVGVLLLVGLLIGGGAMAYRAGVSQGIARAPEVATAISNAAESGMGAPAPGYGYGYGYPYYGFRPYFGFFPFGGIFGSILFLFLFFGLLRMIFFRRWAWGYGRMREHSPWKGHAGHWGTPPWEREGQDGEAGSDTKQDDK